MKTIGEDRSISQQDSNAPKDTIQKKIPENELLCFRGWEGSILNIFWSSEVEICLIWRKIVFQTASDWIESTYSKDRQFAFYDDSEQKKESLLRLFVVAWS